VLIKVITCFFYGKLFDVRADIKYFCDVLLAEKDGYNVVSSKDKMIKSYFRILIVEVNLHEF